MWTGGWLGHINTINKLTENGNWQLSDKIMGLGVTLQQETVWDSTSLKCVHFAVQSRTNGPFITTLKHAFHKIWCKLLLLPNRELSGTITKIHQLNYIIHIPCTRLTKLQYLIHQMAHEITNNHLLFCDAPPTFPPLQAVLREVIITNTHGVKIQCYKLKCC